MASVVPESTSETLGTDLTGNGLYSIGLHGRNDDQVYHGNGLKLRSVNQTTALPGVDTSQTDRVNSNSNGVRFKQGEEIAHKEPLLIAKLVTKKPYLAFGVTLGLHILMAAVTAALYLSGFEILPVNFNNIPINLRNKDVFLHQEAWKHRDVDAMLYDRSTGGEVIPERTAKYDRLTMQFMYEKEKGNVFTQECLRAIRRFEDEVFNEPEFQNKYCFLNGMKQCQKPVSIVRFFDGTLSILDPIFNDTNFDNIPRVLELAGKHPLTRRGFQFFLGKDSVINGTAGIALSSITRSLLFFGYPLAGYDTLRDDTRVQYNKAGDFIKSTFADKWSELAEDGLAGMKFMYMNQIMYWYQLNSQVNTDMLFIICSFCFIFLFAWFQTGSLWLSAWGMFSILFSFVSGNLVYNIILDFKYFGILHILSLFILLGIGADDVFIFCDTWKHSRRPGDTVAERLSECYRRAGSTMFVTSITTAAAFFINSFSPILAMSSFGTFAGVTVIVNYLSIIVFYPTAVMVWHLKWENESCCQGMRKKQAGSSSRSWNARVQEAIMNFLSGGYFCFLMSKVVRAAVLIIFTATVAVFIYFSTTLVPDDRQPRVMKKSHNIERFQDKNQNAFKPSSEDKVVTLYVVWGIKSQNISMCHPRKFDQTCTGKTVWDNSFDLNPPPAQSAMLEFCRRLRDASPELTSQLGIRRDIITGNPQVRCFVENMDQFFKKETKGTRYEMFLPTTETKMGHFMAAHGSLYNMSDIDDNFYRYFETAYAYWISNRHSGVLTADDKIYQTYLGESFDKRDTADIVGHPGMKYGTRLRYAVVAANLTFVIVGTSFENGLRYFQNWNTFLENQTRDMPPSVEQPFHATNFAWQWFHIQQVLVRQGVLSVIVGVAAAWVLLVLTSGNFIVGTMATVTIASVTVCVVGLVPLVGWKLGVLEALNMSLVVGLSVDYAVHLGVAYTYAPCADRKGRVKHALGEIGLSVISGALTTLGSGLFMMFAEIVFFMQFGIFIFATIGFSIVFATTFFLTLLSLIGPQGSTGATAPLIKALKRRIVGRKKSDVTCDKCQGRGFHRVKETLQTFSQEVDEYF